MIQEDYVFAALVIVALSIVVGVFYDRICESRERVARLARESEQEKAAVARAYLEAREARRRDAEETEPQPRNRHERRAAAARARKRG